MASGGFFTSIAILVMFVSHGRPQRKCSTNLFQFENILYHTFQYTCNDLLRFIVASYIKLKKDCIVG